MFPELEPENRSGIPEGRLLSLWMTVMGAWPGFCWYQETILLPMLSPPQVILAICPGCTDTEGGCVTS